ncbi:hypothetical protein DL96DRAFT_1720283 [Flagelloscypha sp. PMI_526]|nr:hypothetical protein DL96DRAFT_1720283 [Flagelloscypha sp. PMI_526]
MASDMSLLQNDDPNNDDMSFWEVRKLEFRVLILGRANAGKTTILERLTDSSVSDSEVRRDGRVLKENSIHGQSERGMHNVTDEIRFISKPGFVFHDSRGFEAGSGDELSRVRDFVDRRSKNVTKLRDQLHAIWWIQSFCLPLDEDRELFDSEKEPFYWGRGITPMIIIFTKKDGAIAKVSSNIKETLVRPEGISDRAYNREIRMRAVQAVEDRVTERMNYMKEWEDMHSSALEFMAIGDMNKLSKASSAACGTLIEKTQNSLTGARVKSLLSVVWVKNMIDKAFWCYHWMLVSHNCESFSRILDQREIY